MSNDSLTHLQSDRNDESQERVYTHSNLECAGTSAPPPEAKALVILLARECRVPPRSDCHHALLSCALHLLSLQALQPQLVYTFLSGGAAFPLLLSLPAALRVLASPLAVLALLAAELSLCLSTPPPMAMLAAAAVPPSAAVTTTAAAIAAAGIRT
jgi:hypothetical protein